MRPDITPGIADNSHLILREQRGKARDLLVLVRTRWDLQETP